MEDGGRSLVEWIEKPESDIIRDMNPRVAVVTGASWARGIGFEGFRMAAQRVSSSATANLCHGRDSSGKLHTSKVSRRAGVVAI